MMFVYICRVLDKLGQIRRRFSGSLVVDPSRPIVLFQYFLVEEASSGTQHLEPWVLRQGILGTTQVFAKGTIGVRDFCVTQGTAADMQNESVMKELFGQ